MDIKWEKYKVFRCFNGAMLYKIAETDKVLIGLVETPTGIVPYTSVVWQKETCSLSPDIRFSSMGREIMGWEIIEGVDCEDIYKFRRENEEYLNPDMF